MSLALIFEIDLKIAKLKVTLDKQYRCHKRTIYNKSEGS
jgi:hypothetical protein